MLTASLFATTLSATVIDFDELNPADRPLYGPGSPDFVTKGATFHGGFYGGWTYSNDNDTTTPGFTNQYAAYTGTDFSSAGNYAVASGSSVFDLPAGHAPVSVHVTNNTYSALSMLLGDSFAKKFGGPTGDDADYFDVTFTGYSAANGAGTATGAMTFRLADYTFADNAQDYIVDTWELLDLTALGAPASIALSWESTDVGSFGINTPTYVAIDNLVLTPEPGSAALLAVAGLLMPRRWRSA
jgi:hypothetical protein